MRRYWLNAALRQRCIVYMTNNEILDGLFTQVSKDGLVLLDARVRHDDDTRLAGEVFIPRERVRFVQIVAADAPA